MCAESLKRPRSTIELSSFFGSALAKRRSRLYGAKSALKPYPINVEMQEALHKDESDTLVPQWCCRSRLRKCSQALQEFFLGPS
jgi:hypothetical protein